MKDDTGQGDIPPGVDQILRYLAEKARGYGNRLKWNEVAKLKSDLMLVPELWHGIEAAAILRRCAQLGMRGEDASQITKFVEYRQQGGRLVPPRSYRGYRFSQPVDPRPVEGSVSFDW
jgi:hypothetical protein